MKLNQFLGQVDAYPKQKNINSSIIYYVKYYFKEVWACYAFKKLHWFATPLGVYSYAKNNLINHTFFELLQFRESLNLIGQDKLGMHDQNQTEWLNQLVGSNNVYLQEKIAS